jgi:hypothetical protein
MPGLLKQRAGFSLEAVFAVGWACLLALVLDGYAFGQSNHHVYLLEAFRMKDPSLFSRDWFTVGTLQYHVLFSNITSFLLRLDVIEIGFLIGHLLCVVVMHAAWFGIVGRMGGSATTFLVSAVAFYASAGGVGLGMYRFMQDGSFLPSNCASALSLLAILFWLDRRIFAAAAAVGAAGIFHLNYACVAILALTLLAAGDALRDRQFRVVLDRRHLLALLIATVPCLLNIALAARSKWSTQTAIPLEDFIDIYVHLRHPHHYDPLAWPTVIWICFLWPLLPAWWAFRRAEPTPAVRKLGRIMLFVLGLQLFALLTAGIWYLSETFVQLSFWRFSIFAKLIACIATAWLIVDHWKLRPGLLTLAMGVVTLIVSVGQWVPMNAVIDGFINTNRTTLLIANGLLVIVTFWLGVRTRTGRAAVMLLLAGLGVLAVDRAWRGELGFVVVPEDDPQMIELGAWAQANTPVDALFVVPPGDASFRLAALRSALVSYKQVPQLNGELARWKGLLDEVLGVDVLTLPRPMSATIRAMNQTYAELPAGHLEAVARRHDAAYVVALRDLEPWAGREVFRSTGGRFVVYQLDGSLINPPDLIDPPSENKPVR